MLTLSPAEVADYCLASPNKHGDDAAFFMIDSEWGFKHFYGNSNNRDRNHAMQKLAAEYGLAPKVGEPMDFAHPKTKHTLKGFFTEICPDILQHRKEYDDLYWWYTEDEDGNPYPEWKKLGENPDKQFWINTVDWDFYGLTNLTKRLTDIGFKTVADLHAGNVGYMHDGSLVCFDFSKCALP